MAESYYTPFMSNIGAVLGQGLKTQGLREQEAERNKLIQRAYIGQPGAMEQLYAVDPQAASQVETQQRQKKQAALQEQSVQASNEDRKRKILMENKELVDRTLKEAAKLGSLEEAQSYVDQVVQQNQALFEGVTLDPMTPEFFNQIKTSYGASDKGAGVKSFQPITLKNRETGEKTLASPTVDPNTGEAKLASFEIPEGFEISAETPEEKRAAEILASGLKKIQETKGKSEEERAQLSIDRAYEAADSIPVIQRSLDLLDMVETGGIDKVQIQAKRLLGIESADEAELTYNLGKTVLSQLKATFGAAFTAEEGKRLERLEANLGKSIAGNRRILEQARQIAERSANRGIKTALKKGDEDTAQEIKDAMNFRFKFKDITNKNEKGDKDQQSTTQESAVQVATEETPLTAEEQAELEQLRQRFNR